MSGKSFKRKKENIQEYIPVMHQENTYGSNYRCPLSLKANQFKNSC